MTTTAYARSYARPSRSATLRSVAFRPAPPVVNDALRRYIGLGVQGVEGRLLSRRPTGTPVPRALLRRAERLRDQRHLLPPANQRHLHTLGRDDSRGVSLCGKGAPAAHA